MQNQPQNTTDQPQTAATRLIKVGFFEIVGFIIIGALIINSLFFIELKVSLKPLLNKVLGGQIAKQFGIANTPDVISEDLEELVLPAEGVELPVAWGDLGKQLVVSGVIDQSSLNTLYAEQSELSEEMNKIIRGGSGERIRITRKNASLLLNLWWALGLGNKNEILEGGEMKDLGEEVSNLASTGGWTIARGEAMDHYAKHGFITLTSEQQALVDKISKNIYRPCCNNSTHFPDCNHGMAMLGLLELMAAQGVSEEEMYKAALAVNSYWFPDAYLTIAAYLDKQGVGFATVNPKDLLSSKYSSSQGFGQIARQITSSNQGQGSSCAI